MSNKHNLKVGQELIHVEGRRSKTINTVIVEKVGRKLAHLRREGYNYYQAKIDLETLRIVHGLGSCYLSLEHYEKEKLLGRTRELYDELRSEMPWGCPENLTIADIELIANLLGVKLSSQQTALNQADSASTVAQKVGE